MTKGQKELKKAILKKGSLLTGDEAFDIYTDYVMRYSQQCTLIYDHKTGKYESYSTDYPMYKLESKAANWYRMTLGILLIQGHLTILGNPVRCGRCGWNARVYHTCENIITAHKEI